MNIHGELRQIGLNSENSIVIGSGILNSLNIRESKDIDVVVPRNKYTELKIDKKFKIEQNHDREILVNDLFEIGIDWAVLNKDWKFEDLLNKSVILAGVRYNTLDFLLEVKRSWIKTGENRDKDIKDIKLIEDYLGGKY